MRTDRDRSTAGVLRKAAELVARGKAAKAVGLLRPLVIAEPDNGQAWCELASAELAAGRHKEAADAVANAGRDPSAAAHADRVRALLLLEVGDPDGAVAAAEAAVSADPDNWRAHRVLARVHGQVGDPARAQAADAWAVRLAGDAGRATRPATGEWLPRKPLRRLAVIGALGTLFLLMAGMPAPAGILAWFGGALAVVLVGLAIRTMPRVRFGAAPMPLRVAIGALVLAVLALSVWTVMLAAGAHSLRLLGFAFVCAAVSAVTCEWQRVPALVKSTFDARR